jgi:hypothetical protein
MRPFSIASICSIVVATGTFAQIPAASPSGSAPTVSATISPAPSPESAIERSIRKKQKHHFNFVIGQHDSTGESPVERRDDGSDDVPAMVVPLVAIVFLTIFGAPVLIVAVILYFGFSKSRMTHRTIRMMVEKGQPVPPELLAPPAPVQRQHSDMRRGVVLVMVGLGLMLFLGAVNDWEGGAWALGIIPFLIGVGYLLVWKLERKKDVPPPEVT